MKISNPLKVCVFRKTGKLSLSANESEEKNTLKFQSTTSKTLSSVKKKERFDTPKRNLRYELCVLVLNWNFLFAQSIIHMNFANEDTRFLVCLTGDPDGQVIFLDTTRMKVTLSHWRFRNQINYSLLVLRSSEAERPEFLCPQQTTISSQWQAGISWGFWEFKKTLLNSWMKCLRY